MENQQTPPKRKRRFGDRNDGRRVRTRGPMEGVATYIMKDRVGSSNYVRDTIEMEPIEEYIRKKRKEGREISLMHLIIAAYVRLVAQRPAINRFISGQKTYTRDDYVEIVLTIKKEMRLESPDTVVKITVGKDATIFDIEEQLNQVITDYRDNPGGGFDKTAGALKKIPGLLLNFAVWLLKFMDYFGWLPRALTKISPFHGSFFITSMGSLGIPPIYHHLYDFGNVPVFCSFGAKYKRWEMDRDGNAKERHYVDFTFVTDERICDGFYFASGLRLLKAMLRHPEALELPPSEIVEDIE